MYTDHEKGVDETAKIWGDHDQVGRIPVGPVDG